MVIEGDSDLRLNDSHFQVKKSSEFSQEENGDGRPVKKCGKSSLESLGKIYILGNTNLNPNFGLLNPLVN